MELVRIESEIAVPADRAWGFVSNFGGISRWNPLVADCTLEGAGIGAVRLIRYPEGPAVRERLVALDDTARRLVYLFLSGPPVPVDELTGAISITTSSPQTCRVAWCYDARYEGLRSQLTEFTAALASRVVRRFSDLEIAGLQPQSPG